MEKYMVSLNSIDKVREFVNIIAAFDCDFDLISGRYVIDAKSIMGIFSLDLNKEVELTVHATGEKLAAIEEKICPFIVG